MAYTESPSINQSFQFLWLKSFLMWAFALTVCMVVIGFPLLILVVSVTSLMAVTLQSVLPMSAVLVVTAAITGIHLLGVLIASAVLTFQGIHPQDVKWLTWLNGDSVADNTSVYASCPLTCEVDSSL